ncbi:MAG: hypothetical protein KDC46_10375 [Thermoleophilia bacterium]|nr:hypothetical protein [Thermoleophilia bacterium]
MNVHHARHIHHRSTTPFDSKVDANTRTKVESVRSGAVDDALAFLDAEPSDPAGPVKDAKDGASG